jgi:ABC-2 type transport system permease protein
VSVPTSVREAGARPAGVGTAAPVDALRAEWTKLRTLAGTWWLLLAVIALTAAVGAGAASAASCQAAGCGQDPAKVALSGIDLSQAVVAILAVLAISGEYSTGMIRVTLTAMPRRLGVLGAKAVTVTGLALAAGAVGVLASMLAGRLLLPGRGFTLTHGYPPLSLASGPDLRAAAGSVLYLALIALLALGVATAVRDSAVSIGLVLGLLYLFPVIASALNPHWSRHLQQIGPMSAGLSIQATVGLRSLPLTPWQGLGVLALWAAGALIVGGLVLRLRDA